MSTTPPWEKFLGVTSSDLAFSGKYAIQGNYNGFQIFDISNPAKPTLALTYLCPASQSDVSVYKNLLFVSGEGQTGRVDCGIQGVPEPVSKERLRGIRIFDISNMASPKSVANVQTCRGSHTHTVVTDPRDKDNVYIYVSGSAGVRSADELPGCKDGPDRRSGQRAFPSRSDQGAACGARDGGDRELAADLLRPCAAAATGGARTWGRWQGC